MGLIFIWDVRESLQESEMFKLRRKVWKTSNHPLPDSVDHQLLQGGDIYYFFCLSAASTTLVPTLCEFHSSFTIHLFSFQAVVGGIMSFPKMPMS